MGCLNSIPAEKLIGILTCNVCNKSMIFGSDNKMLLQRIWISDDNGLSQLIEVNDLPLQFSYKISKDRLTKISYISVVQSVAAHLMSHSLSFWVKVDRDHNTVSHLFNKRSGQWFFNAHRMQRMKICRSELAGEDYEDLFFE
jgi:hypothetical protein